jgi:hypothetical protein
MLRNVFVLVLGLAGVSALGFTAFEATCERTCCHVPCEGMPLCAPANPVAEPAIALESADIDVSVPALAADEQPAQATQPIRVKLTVPPRLPPCCSGNPIYADGRAPQAMAQKQPMPRSAEEKRVQAKLAALENKNKSGAAQDSAALAKQKHISPTVAIAPLQPNTKSLAASALKQPPFK